MPECGIVRTSAEFESCPDSERPKGTPSISTRLPKNPNFHEEENFLPGLKIVSSTALRLTKLPERCPKDAAPNEITLSHMDSIKAIDQLMALFPAPNSLIEEIQLTFAYFLAGTSIDALAHWRKILGLLANSEMAIPKYTHVYRKYLGILQYQLCELPEEMVQPTTTNTVYKDVQKLIANCSLGGLRGEADYLGIQLKDAMDWQFDDIFDEDPEDLPVVVEFETK